MKHNPNPDQQQLLKKGSAPSPLSCTDIQENGLLVEYIPGTDPALELHLTTCTSCHQELLWLQQLQQDANSRAEECESVMASINWEENARRISSQITFLTAKPLISKNLFGNWYQAAASIILIFALGIGLGYLLFRSPTALTTQNQNQNPTTATLSLARMETSMAKKEITRFFQQTQLVLNDFLQHCDSNSSFSWQDHLDLKRVKSLLQQCRYFSQDLNNPELLSSRDLLQKIQWLLSEILMNDDDSSCIKLQKLQEYIRQERLLFKIHLVAKELSTSEV